MTETQKTSHDARPNHFSQRPIRETRRFPVFELASPGGGPQPLESLRLRKGQGRADGQSNIRWSCSLPLRSEQIEEPLAWTKDGAAVQGTQPRMQTNEDVVVGMNGDGG